MYREPTTSSSPARCFRAETFFTRNAHAPAAVPNTQYMSLRIKLLPALVASLVAVLGLFAGPAFANPSNSVLPAISSSGSGSTAYVEGATLTTGTGTWSGSGTITYTYQWEDCNSSGSSCSNVTNNGGASTGVASTYALLPTDVGKTLRAVVTATDSNGSTSATSAATVVATASYSLTETSTSATTPFGIALGSDSNLWVTDNGGTATDLLKMTPSGAVTSTTVASNSYSYIASGSDGNLWYTSFNGHGYSSVTTAGATGSTFALGLVNQNLYGIVNGPNGNLWIASAGAGDTAGAIFEVTTNRTSNGCTLEVFSSTSHGACSTLNAGALGSDVVAIGSNGINLYVTQDFTGTTNNPCTPTSNNYYGIDVITTAGVVTQYCTTDTGDTNAAALQGIASDGNGNMWFTENLAGNIVKFNTTSHAFTKYPIPTTVSKPTSIAKGADGNMWFTESRNPGKIGSITPSGAITEYSPPTTNDTPTTITAGPNNDLFFTESTASNIGRLVLPPVNSVAPTVTDTTSSGRFAVGDSLSTTSGTWTGASSGYAYQWQDCNSSGINCSNIAGATSSTYALASSDAGSTVDAVVTASPIDSGTTNEQVAATSAPTSLVPTPPTVVTNAATSVTATGATLNGTINPNGLTVSLYQFDYGTTTSYASGPITASPAPGSGTSPITETATPSGLSANTLYHYRIEATNAGGNAQGSDATFTTLPSPAGATPVISGTNTANGTNTLTTTTGTWSGTATITSYQYQWQTCSNTSSTCAGGTWSNSAGSGATSATYTPASADVGHYVQVEVWATNASGQSPTPAITIASTYTSGVAPSAPSTPVLSNPTPAYSTALNISSGASSSAGTPSATTYHYQWYNCLTSNSGNCTTAATGTGASGTSSTPPTAINYTPSSADVGYDLQVAVYATNSQGAYTGTSATTYSAQTSPVTGTVPGTPSPITLSNTAPAYNSSAISFSGGTSSAGTPAATNYADNWQRCTASDCNTNSGNTATSVGTGSTYTPSPADVGYYLRVQVTASNTQGAYTGTSGPTSSTATAYVTGAAPGTPSTPVLSNTTPAYNSSAISISSGGTSSAGVPSTTNYAYNWQDCSVSGCGSGTVTTVGTDPSYTPQSTDVGYYLRLSVTTSNTQGNYTGTSGTTSASTAYVTGAVPSAPSTPVLSSNSPADGTSLTISSGGTTSTGTPAASSYSYQWQDSPDGTTATYTPNDNDIGKYLRVQVTATSSQGAWSGTSPAATSLATTNYVPGVAPSAPSTPVLSSNSPASGTSLTISSGGTTSTGTPDASSYSYQWQNSPDGSTWSNATGTGATTITYTPNNSDVGDYLRVQVTASNSISGTQWVGSQTNSSTTTSAPTTNYVPGTTPTPPNTPIVTGTRAVGDTLTSNGSGSSGTPIPTYSYQWQDCTSLGSGCVDIAGATTHVYTLTAADVGEYVRVIVNATNSTGQWSGNSSPAASPLIGTDPISGTDPTNTSLPVISGTTQDGQTLTTTDGTWTGSPSPQTFTYQWYDCSAAPADGFPASGCAPISGATSNTYTLTGSDVGYYAQVIVTASNSTDQWVGTATATSVTPTTSTSDITPTNTAAPAITDTTSSGSFTDGDALSTTTGSFTGDNLTYSYQWQRYSSSATTCSTSGSPSWQDIGTDSASYTLVDADTGCTLQVLVTATNSAGSATGTSSATPTVASLTPTNTSLPVVTGSTSVGSHLTEGGDGWTGSSSYTFTYQWQDCASLGSGCTSISGANASTYTLQASDVGYYVQVVVTAQGTAPPGASASATSATPTAYVSGVAPSAPSPAALSSDSPAIGTALTIASGGTTSTGTPAATSYLYQWQDSGDGSSWSDIPGATSATYTPVAGDIGKYIRVEVAASNALPGTQWTGSQTDSTYTDGVATTGYVPGVTPSPPATPSLSSNAPAYDVSLSSSAGAGATGTPTPTYAYQWQSCATTSSSSCADISGATSQSYTPAAGDVGSYLRVGVRATNGVPGTQWTGAQTESSYSYSAESTSGVSGTIPTTPSVPTVTGTPTAGDVLTSSSGTGSTGTPTPTYTYQWQDCTSLSSGCTDIPGATNQTYTLTASDVGRYVQVLVTATNSTGQWIGDSSSVTSTTPTSAISGSGPINAGLPVISGTTTDGQTLSTTNGTWSGTPTPTFSYQWHDCGTGPSGSTPASGCTAISGATGQTYTLAGADVGYYAQVVVTATNSTGQWVGSATATSVTPTTSTSDIPPASTAAPTISGTTTDGQALSATTGTFTGDNLAYSYQWCTSGAGSGSQGVCATGYHTIPGATSSTYALTDSDVGSTLEVAVTTTNSAGSATGTSSATSTVQAVPTTTAATPIFTGAAVDGSTLTATNDGSSNGAPSPTYSYQWQRDDGSGGSYQNIPGATSSSYTLTDADVGYGVQVVGTASNGTYPGGGTASATSTPSSVVQAVAPVNTVLPSISGVTESGSTLTAHEGVWTGAPAPTYSYQWQRDDGSGGSYQDISGASSSTYLLTSADVGYKLRVVVSASNASDPGGATVPATSTSTATIQASPPVLTGAPAISGTAQDGYTLSTTNGSWSGQTPIGYAYQWRRGTSSGCDGSSAPVGTNADTYDLTSADVGDEICVTVTATNAAGSTPATSAPTGVVNGSTELGPPSGSPYVISIDNSLHQVTVPAGTTGVELAGAVRSVDSSNQIYEINGQAPTNSPLITGYILNVIATDPAEQDYEIIVQGSVAVYGQVTGGALSTTPATPTNPTWTTAPAATGNTDASYTEVVGAYDDTGSGAGWHETITSTQYVGVSGAATDSGKAEGNSSSSGNPFEFGASGDSTLGTTPTDETSTISGGITTTPIQDSYAGNPGDVTSGSFVIPQGGSGIGSEPLASTFYDAGRGTGMGDLNLTLPVNVVIPADAYAGTYQSTVTFAIVSGP